MTPEEFSSFLSKIRAKAPHELLEHLGRSVASLDSASWESFPLVSLMLRGGQQIQGRLVRWERPAESGNSGAQVVLCATAHNGGRPEALIYVRVDEVSACAVHGLDQEVDRLTFGEMAYRPSEEAPSRLSLKRLSEKLGRPLEVDWDSVPEIPTALLNLRDLMQATALSLQNIGKDKLGMESLASIQQVIIRHMPSVSLSVQNEKSKLVVQLDLSKSVPKSLLSSLKELFEEKL